jgi:hypothetical protein
MTADTASWGSFVAQGSSPRVPVDPGRIARVAQFALSVMAGQAACIAVLGLAAMTVSRPDVATAYLAAATGIVLLYPVCGVIVMIWTFRVHRNARRMTGSLQRSDHWAWAGWVVPIASLFVPYRIIADVYRRHRAGPLPPGVRQEPVPVGFRVWWGLWLASLVLDAPTGDWELIAGVVASVAAVAAALLAVQVVRQVTDRQIAHALRIQHEAGVQTARGVGR